MVNMSYKKSNHVEVDG